jgi:hypothetical protein
MKNVNLIEVQKGNLCTQLMLSMEIDNYAEGQMEVNRFAKYANAVCGQDFIMYGGGMNTDEDPVVFWKWIKVKNEATEDFLKFYDCFLKSLEPARYSS